MENMKVIRARLIRRLWINEYISIGVIVICVLLALYGQQFITFVFSPLRSVVCGQYSWLLDWFFGGHGTIISKCIW